MASSGRRLGAEMLIGRAGAGAAGLCLAVALAACSGAATPPRASATPSVSAPASGTPGGSAPPASASPSAPARTGLDGCPTAPAAASGLPVLWRGGAPDDLAVAADGALWVSDGSGQVVDRVVAGVVTRTIRGIADPEGVLALPSGDLVVAEQGRQRILLVHADGTRSVLLTLPSAGTQLGVDGIAYDAASDRVIVPDSPHGAVMSVALSHPGSASQPAQGLGRVVGAAVDPAGGGLWVVAEAEAPHGLVRVDGTARTLGNLAQLDDIVELHGLLYVTDLRNHSVHAVDPRTGADRAIATGLEQPQGLAVLPDGGLAVADSTRGVVQRVRPCG